MLQGSSLWHSLPNVELSGSSIGYGTSHSSMGIASVSSIATPGKGTKLTREKLFLVVGLQTYVGFHGG